MFLDYVDRQVPHTLEHLIFLGSEEYPYKGVLDSLANRAFAQGTNAWTANDVSRLVNAPTPLWTLRFLCRLRSRYCDLRASKDADESSRVISRTPRLPFE